MPALTRAPVAGRHLALVLGVSLLATACGSGGRQVPRNLLLVVLDTTRADHLSTYGHALETSPTVTRLAERGVRFDRAYASSSLTPVSAGTFLTGNYPPTHGVRSLFTVAEEELSRDVTTLAEHLGREGLSTGGFISAVPMSGRYGLDRGFDVYEDKFGHKQAPCGNAYQRRADETTDMALEWLTSNGLDPFFLFVHYFDSHDANLAPPREFLASRVSFPLPHDLDRPCSLMGLADPLKVELYDAEIAYMDAQLERILARLERLRVLEDTLVVVVADHGEGLGDHGNWTHGWLHDEQLRVPLVMAGPGIPVGGSVDSHAPLVDLTPTLLELFDLDESSSWDGESLLPAIENRPYLFRELYAEVHHAVEDKLERDPEMYAFSDGTWKYIHRPANGRHELYHLAVDPAELENLYREGHPEAARLLGKLESMRAVSGRRFSAEDLPEEDAEALGSLGYLGDEGLDELDD